jgi:hypothetical protein
MLNACANATIAISRTSRVAHTVHPLGLVQRSPSIYLVCRFDAHGDVAALPLHRILSAEELDHTRGGTPARSSSRGTCPMPPWRRNRPATLGFRIAWPRSAADAQPAIARWAPAAPSRRRRYARLRSVPETGIRGDSLPRGLIKCARHASSNAPESSGMSGPCDMASSALENPRPEPIRKRQIDESTRLASHPASWSRLVKGDPPVCRCRATPGGAPPRRSGPCWEIPATGNS